MSLSTPTPRTDGEITFTGAYTCTHHNDQQRAACPVCLVATLTTERDQLRSDCENETKWAAHYLAQAIAARGRAERAEADAAAYFQRANSFSKIGDEAEAQLATEWARLEKMRTLLTASNAKLAPIFGELTAGESRTVRAVLKYVLSIH